MRRVFLHTITLYPLKFARNRNSLSCCAILYNRMATDHGGFPSIGLLPKQETEVVNFLRKHPEADGRGVVVAILDTGVDPAAHGLQVTSTGEPKIIDVIDCSGSGDVDTSTIVQCDGNELLGLTGRLLKLNTAWTNPTRSYHLGFKRAYEMFPKPLVARLQEQRRSRWDMEQHQQITEAQRTLAQFEAANGKGPLSSDNKKIRAELEERFKQLQELQKNYEDPGPVHDVVVFHDGDVWRAAVDVSETGDLSSAIAMTDFHRERQHGVISPETMLTYVVNIYEEGNTCSLVATCGSHGTHVAGIVGAYYPEQPELNGIAPGCQIVSLQIGDSRLETMETGTALVRALLAVARLKCDLINLSYGEAAVLFNSGRYAALINQLIDEKGVIFVTSGGNDGPGLSSVGAPTSITSSVIGVGAYVSPALMQAAHSLLDKLPEIQYTWSSRGPTMDGALGISVSAPGGAISPVPTWTLQKSALMEGTSMASPNCCGGVALILSALKAANISYSPYRIQRGMENTARPVRGSDAFTHGHGLLQVERAYDYIVKHAKLVEEDVRYEVSFPSSPSSGRGLYLRRADEVNRISQTNVKITPFFRNENGQVALHNAERVSFELRLSLVASEPWVQCPEHFILLHGGRGFNIRVDPTGLPVGAHYAEVRGFDISRPDRGPLFRVPITVVRGAPLTLSSPGGIAVTNNLIKTSPGDVHRFFWYVPQGATWAELILHGHNQDRSRTYVVHAIQPQVHRTHKEHSMKMVVALGNEIKDKGFPLIPGTTLELSLAHYWNSLGTGELSFELRVHGLEPVIKLINLFANEGAARVDVQSQIRDEELAPICSLNVLRQSLRPTESFLRPLPSDHRDTIWDGRQIFERVLAYTIKLSEGLAATTITPMFPLLNNLLYESEYESQLWMIFDSNKRLLASGDTFPHALPKISKGDYTLRIQVRHDNIEMLNKLEKMLLQLDYKLKDDIKLDIFPDVNSARAEKNKFSKRMMHRGETCVLFINPPSSSKLPKDAKPGDVLTGSLKMSKAVPREYEVLFHVPPETSEKKDKESNGDKDDEKSLQEKSKNDLRDLKIKWLLAWHDKGFTSEYEKLLAELEEQYHDDVAFLVAKLNIADTAKERSLDNVISAADAVRQAIDVAALTAYFGIKHKMEDSVEERLKKETESKKSTLIDALSRKALALSEKLLPAMSVETAMDDEVKSSFLAVYSELEGLVETTDTKHLPLRIAYERINARPGAALKFIHKYLSESELSEHRRYYELRRKLLVELGWNHWDRYEASWNIIRFPKTFTHF